VVLVHSTPANRKSDGRISPSCIELKDVTETHILIFYPTCILNGALISYNPTACLPVTLQNICHNTRKENLINISERLVLQFRQNGFLVWMICWSVGSLRNLTYWRCGYGNWNFFSLNILI